MVIDTKCTDNSFVLSVLISEIVINDNVSLISYIIIHFFKWEYSVISLLNFSVVFQFLINDIYMYCYTRNYFQIMSYRRILNFVPCYRCVTFNRMFNAFHKVTKNQLEQFKYFSRRNFNEQSIFDLNTNVSKDVLLYKSSSDRTYKMISIFSIVQFGFWLTVADSYNVLLNKESKINENDQPLEWLDKLKIKGKMVTLGIPVGCLCMGKK